MIISHRHRFVFIKTMKTAGTSIEVLLSQLCGEDDVVTPFGRPEAKHRPRNFQGFYNHMSAAEVRAAIGPELWNSYFTFCFERNPWDKAVSHYCFVKGRAPMPPDWSFEEFLAAGDLPHNLPLYGGQSGLLVDFVGKYERLQQDLATVLDRCGVACTIELPRAKSQYRVVGDHYSRYYDDAKRDFIARQFQAEIALHGYSFESEAEHEALPAGKSR